MIILNMEEMQKGKDEPFRAYSGNRPGLFGYHDDVNDAEKMFVVGWNYLCQHL